MDEARRRLRHSFSPTQPSSHSTNVTGSSAATARITKATLLVTVAPKSPSASPISLRLRWPAGVWKRSVSSWVSIRRRWLAASLLACSSPASISDRRWVMTSRSATLMPLSSW